ncbi:hypothetical protein C0J52_12394 [Blattella germanica]|nr:hypothetical protein C0J52_12394 [Blattella germanica]
MGTAIFLWMKMVQTNTVAGVHKVERYTVVPPVPVHFVGKKREENERNLKQLQKKGPPGVRKGRRLNRWQNNSAKTSGSSEEETNSSDSSQDENTRRKQSKKPSRNKRKRDSFSSSSDREITGKKKKKHVNSDAETEKECIILTDTEKEQLEMKKERSSSKKESEDDKMPNEVDPEAAKEAQDLFKEYLTELVQTGELIAYRAKRLLEKKVGDNSMTDPKHVDKIVDGINLLVKLSGENMQHTADFVNSRHKQWVKGVKRKHKHSKLNKTPTKRNSEKVTEETQKEEISGEIENGVTEENEETIHVNGALNGKVVSSVDENDKLNSDLETNNEELPSEDNEMERDTNKETKSDDNALKENETDIEINLPKKSAKRKKRSVSSEEVSDENVDSNGNGIGRDVKKKSKIDINDEDDSHHIDNNKTIDEDSCEAGIKTHTDSESDENVSSEKNNSADQDHEHNEKSNEETSLQKGATELKLNSASKHKELDSSAISITSMSTVKMDKNESFDLFNDSKEEEILEKETSNTEVSKGKEEVQNEKDDSSDATIEFLNTPEPASDNSEMTEVEVRNGKKDCSSESEENTKEQNGEVCDPLSLSESVNNNFKENKVVENVTENEISNNSDSDENNLEAVDHNKVSDDEKASDIENLQLSGDDSKEDGENSVSLEAKQALLGYTSDDEAEDEDRPKKKKGRKKKTKTDNDSKVEDNSSKSLKKRRIGPKSKTKQFRSSSSSSATDEESDGSSSTKHESSKKKKFRLKDTEAYKQDKKLRWKCNVQAIKLSEDEFQKYYENYYTNESSKSEEETRDDKEILSLLNLKALKKGSGKKSQDNSNESETEESDSSDKRKKNSKPKRDKAKEQEQRLLDFFNNEDDNDTHGNVYCRKLRSSIKKNVV